MEYDTLIGSFEKGGINLPDFESSIKANRVKWAVNLLDEDNHKTWKRISLQHLASVGVKYWRQTLIREKFSFLQKCFNQLG